MSNASCPSSRSLINLSHFCGLIFLTASAGVSQVPTPLPENTTVAQKEQDAASTVTKPTAATYIRLERKARYLNYLKSMFGLEAVGKNIVSAGFSTGGNTPDEWGPHWDGFGKRFASNMGKGVIKSTTMFALEEAFKLDSRYVKSTKRDAASKIKNALTSPFIARTASGKKVFGFPRVAGSMVSSVVAIKLWYPDRFGWKDGLRNGVTSIGTTALFNLAKEFIRWK